MARPVRRAITAIVAAGIVVLALPAGSVSAHAGLDESSPASGAVLEDSPTELVLDFDEPVETTLGGVDLSTSDGNPIDIGAPVATDGDPSRLVVADVPSLADGVYVVLWQVTSSDGHPARGAFTFQVGTGSGGVDTDALVQEALAGRTAARSVTWTLGIGRFLAFVGVTVLVGAVALHIGTTGGRPSRRSRRVWSFALVTTAVGSVLVFVLQGAYVTAGGFSDAFDLGLWGDVAGTRLGTAVLVRLALLAVAAVVVRRLPTSRAAGVGLWGILSVALVLTFSSTGHPSASSPAALGVALDAVHLLGVALWLGGLVGLALTERSPEPDDAAIEMTARRFSVIATVAVPVIVATGVWQTWRLLDSLSDITATTWGRALLVKTSLVVVLVTLGGVSRWLLRHDGAASIRRLVVTELAVGGLVLAVTAGLVATPPTPPPAAQVFSANLVQGSLIVDVSLTPGRIGSNEVHVVFSPPGGTLQPVLSAEARMSLPSQDLPAVPIELVRDGPNHYIGTIQIPSAGDWKLDVVAVPQDNSTVLLSTTVPIPG